MAEEIWKDIPGYEGEYQISDAGKVKRLPRILAGSNKDGYLYVRLHGKRYGVHQLVLRTFVGPCPDGMVICHNNSDPRDNRLENLRYDTQSGNAIDRVEIGRNSGQRLSVDDVRNIRKRFANGESDAEIASSYGVSRHCINRIRNRGSFSWLE